MVSGKKVWHIPHTKSGKSQHVILNPIAIDILEALQKMEGNPYLFPGKVKGNPTQNPMKVFKRIVKRAGIEESFRLYDIRHSVASLIINNGGTLYDVLATLANARCQNGMHTCLMIVCRIPVIICRVWWLRRLGLSRT